MKSTKQTKPHNLKALEIKLNESSINPHTIYFKEHTVREQSNDKPPGRTLFLINIPPYVDEKGIANAFSEAGVVDNVIFACKPSPSEVKTHKFIKEHLQPSFRVCYMVFKKVAQLHKALTLTKLRPITSNDHQILVGMKKWAEEYNSSVVPSKALKESIESFMRVHDKEMKEIEKISKKLEKEDDDGWITVTKKGKVQSFARSEKVENKIMAKEENNKKRKELKNFYTFQIRESKMKHIVALRQKFEEDKKKIAQIKQSRRFKPF
ncbi:ribosomal RNA-processing protein 7 homolog A [Aricia agestis]|uniref:ribosomal RNA-processing protein 7 homolog A n=1 Tax=Aricia agestis TaxID=91739 RepID=UPI001C20A74F|nr:ribosomal RNA-processing protein 7 homolog A [Aricia agestis]